MSAGTGEINFPDTPEEFFAACKNAAEVHGALVVEHFTCLHCGNKQMTTHGFKEIIPCGNVDCLKPMKSRVPPMPQAGQVTPEMWVAAVTSMRKGVPKVNQETIDWIEKQEGAMKSVAITYSTYAIHQALDALQALTRAMSGGHGFK